MCKCFFCQNKVHRYVQSVYVLETFMKAEQIPRENRGFTKNEKAHSEKISTLYGDSLVMRQSKIFGANLFFHCTCNLCQSEFSVGNVILILVMHLQTFFFRQKKQD